MEALEDGIAGQSLYNLRSNGLLTWIDVIIPHVLFRGSQLENGNSRRIHGE